MQTMHVVAVVVVGGGGGRRRGGDTNGVPGDQSIRMLHSRASGESGRYFFHWVVCLCLATLIPGVHPVGSSLSILIPDVRKLWEGGGEIEEYWGVGETSADTMDTRTVTSN